MGWNGTRAGKVTRLLRTFAAQPVQVGRALPGELTQWRERGGKFLRDEIDNSWDERYHALLGAPWPCGLTAGLDRVRGDIGKRLAEAGLTDGRYTYAYYSDAEMTMCRAIWCAIGHTWPEAVVETGVAHGVSSRVILEALNANHKGHLWSIDLPFPFDPGLHAQTGVAVTQDCRPRWTYLEGPSRKLLPSLVRRTGPVQVFVHDSLHTARNTLFEMEQIARIMPEHGVMIIDDIGSHSGFSGFRRRHPEYQTIVCESSDHEGLFGIAVRSR